MKRLPDDLYLYIFDFLNFYDRRQAKQVSKQWHEILCRPRYNRKEVLNLEYCLLDDKFDPMLTLMSSNVMEFSSVRIRRGVKWSADSMKSTFFSFVGSYTRELILDIEPTEFEQFQDISQYFPHLETIIAKGIDLEVFLKKFQSLSENLKYLHVREINDGTTMELPQKLERLTCEFLTITGNSHFFQHDDNIKDLVQRGHTKFKSNFNGLKRTLTLPEITTIFAENSMSNILLSYPKNNLKEIKLKVDERGCFYVHETLHLFGVKRIWLDGKGDPTTCSACLLHLVKSCPKVLHWRFTNFSALGIMNFPEVLVSMKSLEIFHFEVPLTFFTTTYTNSAGHPLKCFNNLEVLSVEILADGDKSEWEKWPSMQRLKVLKVNFEFKINLPEGLIEHLVRVTPNIEQCDFHGISLVNTHLETLFRGWPYLTKMMCCVKNTRDANEKQLLLIRECCRNMKVFVSGAYSKVETPNLCWRMFESVPTLRLFVDFELKHKTHADYCENLRKGHQRSLTCKLFQALNLT